MENEGNVWYFAYGSNLNTARLYGRIKKWQEARQAVLDEFSLTFDSRGYANIILESNNQVYGAAYLINMKQLEILDSYESVHKSIYQRKNVTVNCSGCNLAAITYQKLSPSQFKSPDDWYLELILTGLKEHGWGEDVIELVKRIALGQS